MTASRIVRPLVFITALILAWLPAQAETTLRTQVTESHSTILLASEVRAVAVGEPFWLAVRFTPREHWHTYWKNPGDSGMTPILSFDLPDGWQAADPLYPVPERLPVGPLMNYGYDAPNTLLVKVTPGKTVPETARIGLSAEWLSCEESCIPQSAELALSLPRGEAGARAESNGDLFSTARERLPDPSWYEAGLRVGDESSRLTVLTGAAEAARVEKATFFPAGEGVTTYAAEQTMARTEQGLELTLPRDRGALEPDTAAGVLVLDFKDGTRQAMRLAPDLIQADGPATQGADGATPAGDGKAAKGAVLPTGASAALPLWQAVLFALLGGMVLNLMPCVFPVLSLKAFAFLKSGGEQPAARRLEGWAYTAGILASFLVVVGALLALRAGGAAVGWGFQMQNPIFIAAMTVIMVLVGLSLSGFFELRTGFEGAGQGLAGKNGTTGSFFTGVLATLVATPCTAPLMAPAIGYALTQPIPVVLLVFLSLGFGLALPFLILSHSPRAAKLLPRPGPWMETLRQALAFPMYATAIWLVYLFTVQAGSAALFILLLLLLGLVFAIWLWGRAAGRVLKGAALIFGLAALVAIWFIPTHGGEDRSAQSGDSVMDGAAWSAERLDSLRADGEPVFVYFTADWCITCKVNERVALYRTPTETYFRENDIAVLKGDWTNRNDAIGRVLAEYGRAGVPLYLFFPADGGDAVILPQVLTVDSLLGAIKKAQAGDAAQS
ncbi:protein-disulfide reductase DsbD family protein [Yunchengibacter salinarum]|uniref:protein-disulfide reductase DsbD family protein n=1 Tax=Yunchengibacter salinarum TaxID=3133399 RepID=UPI0035B691D6